MTKLPRRLDGESPEQSAIRKVRQCARVRVRPRSLVGPRRPVRLREINENKLETLLALRADVLARAGERLADEDASHASAQATPSTAHQSSCDEAPVEGTTLANQTIEPGEAGSTRRSVVRLCWPLPMASGLCFRPSARPLSSVGQSCGLLIRRSWVRAPQGVPIPSYTNNSQAERPHGAGYGEGCACWRGWVCFAGAAARQFFAC